MRQEPFVQRRLTRFLSLVLGVFALALIAGAAPSAVAAGNTLTGTVIDINGAAVPEVTVTVASADGKFTEDVVSDAQGGFTVETPGPGDYVVKVDPEQVPPGVRVPQKAEEGVSKIGSASCRASVCRYV